MNISNLTENDIICPCCLNQVFNENKTITPCKHIFHFLCLYKNMISKHRNHLLCPSCRTHLGPKERKRKRNYVYELQEESFVSTPSTLTL